VLFCGPPHTDKPMACEASGCRTPAELMRSWRHHPERRAAFAYKFYGLKQP
jgi:hypothetical protein